MALYKKGIIFSSMEKEMKIINCEHNFFVQQIIVLAVQRVEFVSDRMSYTVLRG